MLDEFSLCESCLVDWVGAVLMPGVICILGFLAKRYADTLERRRLVFDVASKWRVEVFRELTQYLNDLYCYFTYQGRWLELSPADATERKRACDRVVHMNAFLWTVEFLDAYKQFTTAAYAETQGRGSAFRFRANVDMHRVNPRWEDAWSERFVPAAERIRRKEFTEVYQRVLYLAVRDIGVDATKE